MSSDTTPRKSFRRTSKNYAFYVFFVMFGINLLNYLDRYVSIGAANIIAKELHLGIYDIGLLASTFITAYTLGVLPLGIWADRAKRKNVIAFCVAIWSLATILTALTGTFATLILSRILLGFAEAGYYPSGTALLSEYFDRTAWARVQSWWNVGALLGLAMGFVCGGTLAGLFPGSWRLAFVFAGVPGLLCAFLAWRLREVSQDKKGGEERSSSLIPQGTKVAISQGVLSRFRMFLRIKTLLVLIIMQALIFFVSAASVVFLPTYLQQKNTFSLSSGFASTLAGTVIVTAGIIGVISGGYLSDAFRERYPGIDVFLCGISLLLSIPAFVITLITQNFMLFSIFCFITILLLSIYNGPSTSAIQGVVPPTLRASATGLTFFLSHFFGDSFSPFLVGIVVLRLDPTHGQHFLQNTVGPELRVAFLATCCPALLIAGLIGIFGSRWMQDERVTE